MRLHGYLADPCCQADAQRLLRPHKPELRTEEITILLVVERKPFLENFLHAIIINFQPVLPLGDLMPGKFFGAEILCQRCNLKTTRLHEFQKTVVPQ